MPSPRASSPQPASPQTHPEHSGDPASNPIVFVYGTLKRGYERSSVLADQEFLGQATTTPLYRLVDCGLYPGLLPMKPGREIEGELYRVTPSILAELDKIECVADGLYRRDKVLLKPPFDSLAVEAYFYCLDPTHLADCGSRWPAD